MEDFAGGGMCKLVFGGSNSCGGRGGGCGMECFEEQNGEIQTGVERERGGAPKKRSDGWMWMVVFGGGGGGGDKGVRNVRFG